MDLSTLPVRVNCNGGDVPAATPCTDVSKPGRIEKKSNIVDEEFAFEHIIEEVQANEIPQVSELDMQAFQKEQDLFKQDSTRIFDSEREHSSQL